jgi:glycosyltransferase involved in cell wall biosynthesis
MKVAFVSSLNGGVGTFTINMVQELAQDIENIDLYLFAHKGVSRDLDLVHFPRNVRVILLERSGLPLMLKLFLHIRDFKYCGLVHTNYASFLPPLYFVKKIWKVPIIYTSHTIPQPEIEKGIFKVAYLLEKILSKYAVGIVDEHVVVSNYIKNYFLTKYNVDSTVIYNGINVDKFVHHDEQVRQNIRCELGIRDQENAVLFVGSFNRYKNILTLIDSMPQILKQYPNTKFILIGSGDLYNQALSKIQGYEIERQVILIKNVPNIADYYCASDIFVLPSINEMFGIVLLEAMASGLPIVASNGGAIPEVIENAGVLFNPDSSDELASAIIKVICDKSLASKLRKMGKDIVNRYTWKSASRRYLEKYNRLIRGSA